MTCASVLLVALGIMALAILNEATLFPKNAVEVRHIHLQPTAGEWRQQQVWKEVWQESPRGEWKQEWEQEWAHVRVPGQKWHR